MPGAREEASTASTASGANAEPSDMMQTVGIQDSRDHDDDHHGTSDDERQPRESTPPPLPPRPALNLTPSSAAGSFRLSSKSSRPQLQSQATTALSLTGIQAVSRAASVNIASVPGSRTVSRAPSLAQLRDYGITQHGEDSASVESYDAERDQPLDDESLLGPITEDDGFDAVFPHSPLSDNQDASFDTLVANGDSFALQFQHELDEVDVVKGDQTNEDTLLATWKSKFKHFFILSASGKPIYSRHGDDQLISNYIGIAQTIISSYQGENDVLKGFKAGDARIVFLSKGPLNLVAVSRLGESDAQLRVQLESLYMQILSTLTLPSMEKMFSNRPSTDLRRPLQGTDVLLDGLADGFTRGSPSTLLSALECLRLRKTQRKQINDTFLKVRSPNLLYGLVVAAGRLVSVVRPKKHSLHPGDLHLIFNMLFEAGGVKAGGGENWIPLCLPGFNNTGFLYMYVSFFPTSSQNEHNSPADDTAAPQKLNDELAIVLISANKESFFELHKMRDELVSQLETNGSMSAIKAALRKGQSTCAEIAPGTVLQHFLYKSRANVQFTMPSFEPHFKSLIAKRKLLLLYGQLHENLHNRTSHLKVQHVVSQLATALAWETPMFELYCVADAHASRTALAQGANRVVQWIRREEERVFIIGGAVF